MQFSYCCLSACSRSPPTSTSTSAIKSSCCAFWLLRRRGRRRGGKGIHTHWDVCMHAAGCLRNEDFKDNKKLQRANISRSAWKHMCTWSRSARSCLVYLKKCSQWDNRRCRSAANDCCERSQAFPVGQNDNLHFLRYSSLPPQKASNNAQWCLDK